MAYHQPGLRRRTTARGDNGDWLTVTLWGTDAEADAAPPSNAALDDLVDPASVVVRRYVELD